MGHDEVYQIGVCPICSQKDPADLYYNDVMRLYNFLKKKNLKMMIWSDMVNCASAYKTVPALDRLPKDIILLDFIWYFHTSKDIETNLTSKDFNVIIGNLYSSYFPRYESRIRNEKVMGGEVSAWTKTTEYCLQREGKFYDIIYTAQMLWSENYLEACRTSYDRVIRPIITKMRNKIQGVKDFAHTFTLFDGFTDTIDLSVNKTFDAISFTHTANNLISKTPWEDGEKLGFYSISYSDGTSIEIPLLNGQNIYYKGVRQNAPIVNGYFRHTGYVGTWATDEVLIENKTFYKLLWLNPTPEKEIKTVTLTSIYPITLAKIEGKN
jgi:hexosaminidase